MKTIILYVIGLILTFPVNAQVGVNINSPQGVFHVDPKGDTSGATSTSDDVLVNNQGRVGIGTASPTTQLHIKSQIPAKTIALKDGNQADLKMLISDAQGVGTWNFIGLKTIKGTLSSDGKTYLITAIGPRSGTGTGSFYSGSLYDLGGQITLPPGRWCVFSNFLLNTSGAGSTDTYSNNSWMRLSYAETPGGTYSLDIIGAPWSSGAVYARPYGTIQGFSVILNNTSGNKTYYLGIAYADQGRVASTVQVNRLANGTDAENGIIAIKIADN